MAMPRPDQESKAFFESVLPDDPRVQARPMFGNVSGFLNSNMFMGLLGSDFLILGPPPAPPPESAPQARQPRDPAARGPASQACCRSAGPQPRTRRRCREAGAAQPRSRIPVPARRPGESTRRWRVGPALRQTLAQASRLRGHERRRRPPPATAALAPLSALTPPEAALGIDSFPR